MLAYKVIKIRIVVRGNVPIGAYIAKGTVALEICFACWATGGDTVTIVLQKKRSEGESVLRCLVLEDLTAKISSTRAKGDDLGFRSHHELWLVCRELGAILLLMKGLKLSKQSSLALVCISRGVICKLIYLPSGTLYPAASSLFQILSEKLSA